MQKTNWWLPIGLFLIGTIAWLIIPLNMALQTGIGGPEFGGQWLGIYTLFLLITAVCSVWLYVWIIMKTARTAKAMGESVAGFVTFAIFLPVIALIVVLAMQASRAPTPAR